MALLCKARTLCPIASHIFLTCLFFPSWIIISNLVVCFSSSVFNIFTLAGFVIYPPISTPVLKASTFSLLTIPFNVTVYVLLISCFGCVTLYTKSPSFVRIKAPDVYISNLPTGTNLSFTFTKSKTESRSN